MGKKIGLYDIQRNDLLSVRAYYEAHKPIEREAMEVLVMLQDDPRELEQLAADWKFRDSSADAAAANDARRARKHREK